MTLRCTEAFSWLLILERTFESSLAVSVRFSLIRYLVIDDTASKAGLIT